MRCDVWVYGVYAKVEAVAGKREEQVLHACCEQAVRERTEAGRTLCIPSRGGVGGIEGVEETSGLDSSGISPQLTSALCEDGVSDGSNHMQPSANPPTRVVR